MYFNCVNKVRRVRCIVRCAYLFITSPHLNILTSSLLLLLLLSSCSTRRVITVTDHITDTTYVSVRDTSHTVLVRDTTIVNEREIITEHIINRYDPTSGMLTQQEVDRMIQRTRDSLTTHLLDQITHLYDSINSSSHADDHHLDDVKTQGEASLSAGQTFAKIFASAVACVFIIFALIFVAKQIHR